MFDRRTLAACCVLALPSAACLAQNTFAADQYYDNRWYITPFGSYVHPDSNRNAENGWGGGSPSASRSVPTGTSSCAPSTSSSMAGFDTTFGVFDTQNKYKNWSGTLDAQWFFLGRQGIRSWQSKSVQPYLVGGIGAIDNKVETAFAANSSHTSFMANAGVGVVWPFATWGRLVATCATAMSTMPTTPGWQAGAARTTGCSRWACRSRSGRRRRWRRRPRRGRTGADAAAATAAAGGAQLRTLGRRHVRVRQGGVDADRPHPHGHHAAGAQVRGLPAALDLVVGYTDPLGSNELQPAPVRGAGELGARLHGRPGRAGQRDPDRRPRRDGAQGHRSRLQGPGQGQEPHGAHRLPASRTAAWRSAPRASKRRRWGSGASACETRAPSRCGRTADRPCR